MKMKTRRLMGLLAATMACGLTQTSCSKGDTPVIVEEGYSISDEATPSLTKSLPHSTARRSNREK